MPDDALRVVFAGTPDFAVPGLRACQRRGVELQAVYTSPDRPAGRGRRETASAVKQTARELDVAIHQPTTLKTAEAQAQLAGMAPDLLVVVAYGMRLPQAILDTPRLGCWNVHASLLPRWRGAAPIQRALAAGDTETGVCLMRMQAGLDTGPVLASRRTAITDTDTGGSLHDRLAGHGAELLGQALDRVAAGDTLPATPQPDIGVTQAPKLHKTEGELDPATPASVLARTVRAFDPWPGVTLPLSGQRVRIWGAEPLADATEATPGTIVAAGADGIDIACAPGILRITEVQQAGGRRISAADYVNAHPDLRRKT